MPYSRLFIGELLRNHTGISPFAILVTSVFWAILCDPAGLIPSMPLTVCLVVLGRHVPLFVVTSMSRSRLMFS